MCFYFKQSQTAQTLAQRFKAKMSPAILTSAKPQLYNGFQHPKALVITNKQPHLIQEYHWGLIPAWAKDTTIAKNTLNARLETVAEKPSFKSVLSQRCLVLADGFYEWQWLDVKGKTKQKYCLSLLDEAPFAFAGLYSFWQNPETAEPYASFTIITTVANAFMAKIHNTKQRMPIILDPSEEHTWLEKGLTIFKDIELQGIPCI